MRRNLIQKKKRSILKNKSQMILTESSKVYGNNPLCAKWAITELKLVQPKKDNIKI